MEDRSALRAMVRRALHVAVVAAMWVLVVGGATTFAFFFIMTPTRWFYVNAHDFIAWRNGLVLQYNFMNATTGKATPLLSSANSFILVWQWAGTLAAALGSAGLLWAHSPKDHSHSHPRSKPAAPVEPSAADAAHRIASRRSRRSITSRVARAAVRLRRLLRWQVPPRGLWRALLGPDGLSLLDLILILAWFGLHILWLTDMTQKVLDSRRAPTPLKVAAARSTVPKGNATAPLNGSRIATNNSRASASAANISAAAVKEINATAPGRLRSLLAANNSNIGNNTGSSSSIAKSSTNNTSAKTTTVATVKPLPREVQGSLAKYTGFVGNLDLLLLFFPLPRCNFLHWLLQSDFPALVKYHRWLGHGTLLMYSLHGTIYMAIWKADGVFSANMTWAMGSYVNNIAGLISLCAGWLLWITSIPYIRRRFFNLFYSCHILGTVLFMLFAFMHRKDIAGWVLPGVFLYILDVVMRTLQQAFNWTRVSAAATATPGAAAVASLSPHNSVLTLAIQCEKSLSWAGLDIVFLNVPAISWWQWHPFTLATSSAAGDTKMVLHIKTYSHWTQRLAARLATDAAPLKLYVSGPYHGAHRKWITNFDRHIFVAGGIGVTPSLGMLQDLIARRKSAAASSGAAPPGRVSLIWISRSRDELGTMPYEILQEASRIGPDAWLDLQLYLTADGEEGEAEEGGGAMVQQQGDGGAPRSSSISNGISNTGVTVALDCLTATTDVASVDARKQTSMPLSHDYMYSPLLWAAAVLLCFGGGFAGFICAQAYEAHISRTVAVRSDYTHVGMLQFAALGLSAALPPGLLMLSAHLIRAWKSRRTATAQEDQSQQQQQCALHDKDSCTAAATTAGFRLGSALHARLSVASTATFLTDDTSVQQQAPSPYDKTTTEQPGSGAGGGSSHSTTSIQQDNYLVSTEPYIKHGRPDLAALLKEVARTGGGPAAARRRTSLPLVSVEVQDVSATSTIFAADAAAQAPAESQDLDSDDHLDLDLDPSELRVAVFVAGPVRLVEAVEEGCARINGAWGAPGRAYLEAHPLTHEL